MAEVGEVLQPGESFVLMDGSLEADERIIERGMSSFVEVGLALQHIRDHRLYVEAGFDTFEGYCQERWDLAIRTSQQYMAAARVVGLLEARAIARLPQNEHQARPLAQVLNEHGEEAAVRAWSQIVESHEGSGRITGREVARFFKLGGTAANYGKPGWRELLGEVGDSLIATDKKLANLESVVTRRPNQAMVAKAEEYATWADGLARRLRELGA